MKKTSRHKRGQFVIIAVMLVAIMIISIGALLHNAATFYKHEPWEEYSTLISDIELNTRHLTELSLIDYTTKQFPDPAILNYNLGKWQSNLSNIYPDKGIHLSYTLAEGPRGLYGQNLNFQQGLSKKWDLNVSSSAAVADFTLNIDSIGLSGYKFTAESFLKVMVVANSSSQKTVDVIILKDGNVTIPDLKIANFNTTGIVARMTPSYSPTYGAISYQINYTAPETPSIVIQDQRGIKVTAKP